MIIIAAFIALVFFFYFQNQRIKRMEDHHEKSKERFEKLLEILRKQDNDQKNEPDSSKANSGETEN